MNDDKAKKNILKKMYQYQINLGDDNNEKNDKTNFFEEEQKSKLGLTGFVNKENDIRSKLNQILDKYRAPPQIERNPENKKNEVENILSNIENMISKNNANKPNELENYFNKDENIQNQNVNIKKINFNHNNQSQISKLNVSHIKKNSIYNHDNIHMNNNNNNYNNLDVSGNEINNKFKQLNQHNDENIQFFEEEENLNHYAPVYNPYLHLIIEVDVMENLMFEVNKRNKFVLKTDYTSSFYVPDNYEIFVYDPFINFNFNSNLNSLNINNINNNRLNFYKILQQQQQIIMHTQNAHSVNYNNFNNNAFLEKLNTSNLDNNIKNINNTSVRENNNNLKIKNEANYFINNEGEVEMEDNVNNANFAANVNHNGNLNASNKNNNINNAPALICFSSKKNDINPDNHLMLFNRYDLNFRKNSSKNFSLIKI